MNKGSKGLEALKNIKKERPTYFSTLYDLDMWKEDIEVIEKELKVLDIIIKKQVRTDWLDICDNVNIYNNTFALLDEKRFLTEEDFNLLKEVLFNKKEMEVQEND